MRAVFRRSLGGNGVTCQANTFGGQGAVGIRIERSLFDDSYQRGEERQFHVVERGSLRQSLG
jgi:hypothetical protein